jgi:hypothetical protein
MSSVKGLRVAKGEVMLLPAIATGEFSFPPIGA